MADNTDAKKRRAFVESQSDDDFFDFSEAGDVIGIGSEYNKSPNEIFDSDDELDRDDDDEEIFFSETIVTKEENKITPDALDELEKIFKETGLDDFDDVFPIDPLDRKVIEERAVTDIEENQEISFIREKTAEEIKKERQAARLIIEGNEIVKQVVHTGVIAVETSVDSSTPHIREYTNKAKFYKPRYAKPKSRGQAFMQKLILAVAAAVGVGIWLGVEANSYYIFQNGKVNNALNCAFGWLMVENMPIRIDPFYSDVFFTAFMVGAGAIGLVLLFIYLDKEQKKNSRIGHEHGNAHIATDSDFKKYKNKFMEQ